MRFTKILTASVFALAVFVLAGPASSANGQEAGKYPDGCGKCHEATHEFWQASLHGTAGSNSSFLDVWQEGGSQNECMACHSSGYDDEAGTWQHDSITCAACHGDNDGSHPDYAAMEINRDSDLCGQCHTETYHEWSDSTHEHEGMACIDCHSPHTTGLKRKNVVDTCAACHKESAERFTKTTHADNGVDCSYCHMPQLTDTAVGGDSLRGHLYTVSSETCANCHSDVMHLADSGTQSLNVPVMYKADSITEVTPVPELDEAAPDAGPSGYAVIAGLGGLGAGVLLSPWLDRRKKQ